MKNKIIITVLVLLAFVGGVMVAPSAVKAKLLGLPQIFQLDATITPINDLNDWHQIDTPLGVVGIRTGEDRCWVSSTLVNVDSVIFANLQTVDQTATSAHVTEQADGGFVIRLDQSATADVRVGFIIASPSQ